MRKLNCFMGCLGLLAASALPAAYARADIGDDNFMIMAQGVTGAPIGGPTGASGNGGVGDVDAGMDRAHTYDAAVGTMPDGTANNPNAVNSATSDNHPYSNNSDPATGNSEMNDQTRKHPHHHNASDTNKANPGTTSNPSGTNATTRLNGTQSPSDNSGAGNGMPPAGSNTY